MPRPKKARGTRVRDQVHVGYRFTRAQTAMMEDILKAKREEAMGRGFSEDSVSVSSVVRDWVSAALLADFKAVADGAILAENGKGEIVRIEPKRKSVYTHIQENVARANEEDQQKAKQMVKTRGHG